MIHVRAWPLCPALLAVAIAAILAGAMAALGLPADAHDHDHALPAAEILLGLGAFGILAGRRHRPRPFFVWLRPVLALAVVALVFQAAEHSVHHLGDPQAECPVLDVTTHLGGVDAPAAHIETPAASAETVVRDRGPAGRPADVLGSPLGRAPPLPVLA
jgi:peptidoglycan/LPS O-acetylase OafA/YrhL